MSVGQSEEAEVTGREGEAQRTSGVALHTHILNGKGQMSSRIDC